MNTVTTVEEARKFLGEQQPAHREAINKLPPELQRFVTPAGITQQSGEGQTHIWFLEIRDSQNNEVSGTLHRIEATQQQQGQAAGSRR